MVTFTRVIGRMTRLMGRGSTPTLMGLRMKVGGRKTSSMGRGKRPGLMELATLESTRMAGKTAEASSSGPTAPLMKASSLLTIFMDLESTAGQMDEFTQGLGRTIKCMGRVCLPGLTGEGTKETM